MELPIDPKELVPIVLAVALWDPQWAGTTVCCWCDNSAAVWTINKGSARDPKLMRLLRCLCFFFCAVYKIILTARHLPGVRNSSADALSRNNTKLFFVLNLQTSPLPTLIPCELQELVFNRVLLWISPNWTRLTVETALLLPHGQPTALWCVATTISVTDSTSKTHSP